MSDKTVTTGKQSKASFIRQLIAGLFIGIGGILPGVSGGIIAVSFGLYRPMLEAVRTLFKSFKKNFLFLLPIGIGAVIGLVSGAFFLDSVMDKYAAQITFIFIGLVMGGVPSLIKEAKEKANGFKLRYLIAMVFGAGLIFLLYLLQQQMETTQASVASENTLSIVECFIAGGIIAVGTVIPGLSTSFILIFFGWYEDMLSTITSFDIFRLSLMGAGALIVILLTINIVKVLFDKFPGYTYYAILGFLCASMVAAIPTTLSGMTLYISIGLGVVGFVLALIMSRFMDNHSK